MLFLSVDPLTLLTNFVVNGFAVKMDGWLHQWIHWRAVGARSEPIGRRHPGFNEPQQVRYGSQSEVFLDLLGRVPDCLGLAVAQHGVIHENQSGTH
ncbi:hypothetical protein [Pseudomonas sp. St316]|uniref:hypothetical protein n=1 Tax=Pseudomonas sp. St316 TaxID=2678257 RepID=UPI001BB3454B|nr:hypothetical protein [Pseudomonas sp. St316]